MGVVQELKTVKEGVERILQAYPESRNDDRLLIILYWRMEDRAGLPFVPNEVINRLTMPTSIWRMRQKIQAEGRLLPTDPEVRAKRSIREEEMRNTMRYV